MKRALLSSIALLLSFCGIAQKYQSVFWEISGNRLEKSSYLYGTMHTMDKRVFNFKSGVLAALDSCDAFIMELNTDSVNQMAIMNLLMMRGDTTLQTLLSKDDYNLVNKYFTDSLGFGLVMFNKLQPMYTASMISMHDLNTEKEQALDLFFNKHAREAGKLIFGLETVEEQVGAFKSIPCTEQAKNLVEGVKDALTGLSHSETDVMMDAYVAGDLDKLLAMTIASDTTVDSAFSKIFLINRNRIMAERAIPIIVKYSSFIAIGAAHLPGENGVIELLRAKGYTVEPR